MDTGIEVVRSMQSLMLVPGVYKRLTDVLFTFEMPRPGPGWYVHGWLSVKRKVADLDGRVHDVTLKKRRWLHTSATPDGPRTLHDRPPDDLGSLYEPLIIAASLWCWLDGELGLQKYIEPYHHGPATRTVQRWLRKALPYALVTQQRIREILIEKNEPRPFEQLFPGGIPPPGSRRRHGWRDPDRTCTLCQGLTILFRGASELALSAPALLAEARRRGSHPREATPF